MKYIGIDGKTYRGATAEAVVLAMKKADREGETFTVDQFMRRSAATAAAWSKSPVRSERAEDFISDMLAVGVLIDPNAKRERDSEQVD